MLLLKLLSRTLLYILCTVIVVAIAVFAKFIISILIGDRLVYQIPFIGEALLSLEIMEILNILVFAILGMGIGVFTILLPRYFASRVSTFLLIFLVPIIFINTSFFRYYNWVQEFASKEKILPAQAESITNSFLKETNGGIEGFLGFYLYTAKFPLIPSTEREMLQLDELEKKSKARFSQISTLKPEVVSRLFASRGWGIRIVYLTVSSFTTILHFKKGIKAVKRN